MHVRAYIFNYVFYGNYICLLQRAQSKSNKFNNFISVRMETTLNCKYSNYKNQKQTKNPVPREKHYKNYIKFLFAQRNKKKFKNKHK